MIRTLAIISLVSFVLSIVCFAGAVAAAGGAFYIGDDWRFHRTSLPATDSAVPVVPMKAVRGQV